MPSSGLLEPEPEQDVRAVVQRDVVVVRRVRLQALRRDVEDPLLIRGRPPKRAIRRGREDRSSGKEILLDRGRPAHI